MYIIHVCMCVCACVCVCYCMSYDIQLGWIPPDLRSGTSCLRSTTSNLGSATAKWRSYGNRSVGSRYKADHCESTNANKQKLLNNRCARDEYSVYMHWRNMLHHIYYRYNRYMRLDWPDRKYAYTVKNRRRISTFRGASSSKPLLVGIYLIFRVGFHTLLEGNDFYTLLVELQTLEGARILHR